MYVCMYACIYGCMYACMYIGTYVRTYIIYACMYIKCYESQCHGIIRRPTPQCYDIHQVINNMYVSSLILTDLLCAGLNYWLRHTHNTEFIEVSHSKPHHIRSTLLASLIDIISLYIAESYLKTNQNYIKH